MKTISMKTIVHHPMYYHGSCFNPNLLECGGAMRPQRKLMIVETTHAFVKLKQIKAAG